MPRFHVASTLTGLLILVCDGASAQTASGCAPGTTCVAVNSDGTPDAAGTFVAQCRGRFPDFVVPAGDLPGDQGPWFELSQDFPVTPSAIVNAPWLSIDYTTEQGADSYLLALRDHAYEDMIAADFRPENSAGRAWYHMPLMNFGPGARKALWGMTPERSVFGPELGLKPGVRIRNYAIGFYNDVAAVTIGRVWASDLPDLSDTRFAPGSMTFKILYSTATGDDFVDGVDLLEGAPQRTILDDGEEIPLRLMQMDLAAAAPNSPTGWVFGTLAYDADFADPDPWRRMRPVGLAWGNDEGVTPEMVAGGTGLTETIVSPEITAYAAGHLGWAGRMNGPVDNPASSCLSCHGTAQTPRTPLLPVSSCETDDERLIWFRNLDGSMPFGLVDNATCNLLAAPPQAPVSLDYSLQMAVAVESMVRFGDINPCMPVPSAATLANREAVTERVAETDLNTPRIQR